MSEYPIGTATSTTDDPVLASTTDGRPAGRADVRVVDATGAPVDVGDEGDLIIRGPGLFQGYYKRPDLDVDSFTSDGYLKTGDRARLLDDRGHIRISGRTKDIIIRGGENIPVVEIENILLTHPAVKEIALVPVPDDRLGETACACVVLQTGGLAGDDRRHWLSSSASTGWRSSSTQRAPPAAQPAPHAERKDPEVRAARARPCGVGSRGGPAVRRSPSGRGSSGLYVRPSLRPRREPERRSR